MNYKKVVALLAYIFMMIGCMGYCVITLIGKYDTETNQFQDVTLSGVFITTVIGLSCSVVGAYIAESRITSN